MAVTQTDHNLLAPARPGGVVVSGNFAVCVAALNGSSGDLFESRGYFSVVNLSTLTERGFGGLDNANHPVKGTGLHSDGRVFACGNVVNMITPATGAVESMGSSTTFSAAVSAGGAVVRLTSGSSAAQGTITASKSTWSGGASGFDDAIGSSGSRLFLVDDDGAPSGGPAFLEIDPSDGSTVGTISSTLGTSHTLSKRGVFHSTLNMIFWAYSAGFVGLNMSTDEVTLRPGTPSVSGLALIDWIVGGDGYLYGIGTAGGSHDLVAFDPQTWRWARESITTPGDLSSGVAWWGDKLWTASGEPAS